MPNYFDSILKYISVIGLPIDSSDAAINKKIGRHGQHHYINIENVQYIAQYFPDIKIKIGTVVLKDNISCLYELGNFLNNYKSMIDVWRIYQFSPIGEGAKNKDQYYVSDFDFYQIIDNLIKT